MFQEDFHQLITDNLPSLIKANELFGGVFIYQIEEDVGLTIGVDIDENETAFTFKVELGALQNISPQEVFEQLQECLSEYDLDFYEDATVWQEVTSTSKDRED